MGNENSPGKSDRIIRAERSAKKAAARKKKAGAKKQKPALVERVEVLSRGLSVSHRDTRKALRNYKGHLSAYSVLETYLNEQRTTVSKGDAELVGASKFTDDSNYSPLLKRIASAYKAVKTAEKAESNAKADLKKVRKDKSEAVRKYNATQKSLSSAEGQVTKLRKEVEKITEGRKLIDYGSSKLMEMMAWGYDRFEPALKTAKGLKALERETKYKGQETVATVWLRESQLPALGKVDVMIESVEGLTKYVRDITPPKRDKKGKYDGRQQKPKPEKKK